MYNRNGLCKFVVIQPDKKDAFCRIAKEPCEAHEHKPENCHKIPKGLWQLYIAAKEQIQTLTHNIQKAIGNKE